MADLQGGSQQIQGATPHDDVDAGNPVKIGGKASTALPTAVADGDRVDGYFDEFGRQQVVSYGNVAHDDVDSGEPVKIGGAATAALPTVVDEGDRVDASFDLQGQLRITNESSDPLMVAQPTGSAFNMEGDTNHDAGDSGAPVKVGGHATAGLRVAVTADGDRVDASFDRQGQLRVTNETSDPLSIQGNVANDAPDAGNPVAVGYHAVTTAVAPPIVSADNDRATGICTPEGVQYTIGGHPNIVTREYLTTGAQTDDAIIDTIAAGSFIVVTSIDVTVDEATTAGVGVRIGFGTASVPTAPASGASVVGMALSHPGLAAGSGMVRGNGSGIVAQGGSGEELRITNDVPTTGSLRVVVSYYIITL